MDKKHLPKILAAVFAVLTLALGITSAQYKAQVTDLSSQLTASRSARTTSTAQYEAKIEELQTQLQEKQTEIDSLWDRATVAQQNIDDVYAKLDASSNTSSSRAAQAPQASQSTSRTVYVTNTGAKYHRSGCRYLKKSQIKISLSDAKAQGYSACSICGG